jgi:hypothetical protein
MRRLAFRTGRLGLAGLGLGLIVLSVHASFAQQVRPAGQPGGAPAIWVVSKLTGPCEPRIPRAVLQQDVEARLRGAGVAISRVHTATLMTNIDCTPVSALSRTVAVHACLELSERASTAPRVTATRWKKCQSYACSNATCEARARSELRGLVDAFLVDIPPSDSSIAPAPPVLTTAGVPAPAPPAFKLPLSPAALFYLLYVINCIAVVIRWEFCKLRAH